jgi:2,4-diaminopentanoate dehydrogenase
VGTDVRVGVWGTGNMGRAAIRAVVAHPELELAAVRSTSRAGQDAGEIASLPPLGVVARDEPLSGLDAVFYAASGDLRPDAAADDVRGLLADGAVVVTPSLYALYDWRSAPPSLVDPLQAAAKAGGGRLFVSGIDPGWGNDVLPLLVSGLGSSIEQIRCQELFDYSTYDQPEAVRGSVGMGGPMDVTPPMVLPGVPTLVWGGQLRLMARGLGVELDRVVERVERLPLDSDVTNAMGVFPAGTQGALRFEVAGVVADRELLVIEHVTRIHPSVAPYWPSPPDGGAGAHTVVVEGTPRIVVTVEATAEGGNRAAGGNATAAARLVNALPWLSGQAPGLYDALDVPVRPARCAPGEVLLTLWAGLGARD